MSLVVLMVVARDWPKEFCLAFHKSEAAGMVRSVGFECRRVEQKRARAWARSRDVRKSRDGGGRDLGLPMEGHAVRSQRSRTTWTS